MRDVALLSSAVRQYACCEIHVALCAIDEERRNINIPHDRVRGFSCQYLHRRLRDLLLSVESICTLHITMTYYHHHRNSKFQTRNSVPQADEGFVLTTFPIQPSTYREVPDLAVLRHKHSNKTLSPCVTSSFTTIHRLQKLGTIIRDQACKGLIIPASPRAALQHFDFGSYGP